MRLFQRIRNIRRFERATRVQSFGRDYLTDFDAASKAALLFRELDPIADALTAARVGQLRRPAGKQARIDALSADFKDIARTSRAIALDAAIQNKYSRDPAKLAAWKSASHTERPAKKSKTPDPAP